MTTNDSHEIERPAPRTRSFFLKLERIEASEAEIVRLRDLNAELVYALEGLVYASDRKTSALPTIARARAAIAKARGKEKA